MKQIKVFSNVAVFSLILSLFVGTGIVNAQTYQYGQNGYQTQPSTSNQAPIFRGTPDLTTAKVGRLYTTYVNASDPDGDHATFSLTQAPRGMTISADRGLILWTPSADQGGKSHSVTVSATDTISQPATQTFTVAVAAAPAQTSTATTATNSLQATEQKSSSFSLFGLGKKNKKLEITDVVVTSGPRNIYTSVSAANCNVVVSWNTTVPTAGQVVFGATSQPNVENFIYDQAAIEGTSLSTVHEVTLPACLEEKAYYFRIVAFSSAERVVSEEKTILPIPIETVIAAEATSSTDGTASIFETLLTFVVSPIAIVLVLAVIIFFVIRKFRGRTGGSGGAGPTEEPVLNIPHH